MASSMMISLIETAVRPVLIISPNIIRVAPAVSIIEAACILVKTSGIRINPTAPISRNNDPLRIMIFDKYVKAEDNID
tara:strand:- start:213 stop:446 length:234 start_codon:yes stop_codon:yes gene_type:complete